MTLLVAAMSVLAIMFAIRGKVASRNSLVNSKIASVAVLPLANASGDPGQDYLAGGMTDALTTDLSKIRGLKVVSRTSAPGNQTKVESPSRIGQELNVAGIVEGSVARSGNSVHVSIELIRTASGTAIWAETYDGNIQELIYRPTLHV